MIRTEAELALREDIPGEEQRCAPQSDTKIPRVLRRTCSEACRTTAKLVLRPAMGLRRGTRLRQCGELAQPARLADGRTVPASAPWRWVRRFPRTRREEPQAPSARSQLSVVLGVALLMLAAACAPISDLCAAEEVSFGFFSKGDWCF